MMPASDEIEVLGLAPGASATFSVDMRCRYMLTRDILPPGGTNAVLGACGLNPSTADAFVIDPTVRRELGFGRAWGCRKYMKANAYAHRATVPADMWKTDAQGIDIIGYHNDDWITYMLDLVRVSRGIALACWGVHAKPARVIRLAALADEAGVEWQCLGINKDGSPKHPLYLPKKTELVPWFIELYKPAKHE